MSWWLVQDKDSLASLFRPNQCKLAFQLVGSYMASGSLFIGLIRVNSTKDPKTPSIVSILLTAIVTLVTIKREESKDENVHRYNNIMLSMYRIQMTSHEAESFNICATTKKPPMAGAKTSPRPIIYPTLSAT